ncbi:agenet domain-containing protein / bromo-adjacenthomology (BAH) domain-containing protein [Striga asiatica]|uniref:Agenet domain-containing protein / bromo-adjacenthomology (BAH) domain-containing protein n=1 Tax=Striga asiatica TaxID=4170 RepID=A0A5A7Q5P0_STRAF|nr:agenet domain-containing protein / bromo-adjacenthomology (BAH) domain-containing protein [Striga asiatica]
MEARNKSHFKLPFPAIRGHRSTLTDECLKYLRVSSSPERCPRAARTPVRAHERLLGGDACGPDDLGAHEVVVLDDELDLGGPVGHGDVEVLGPHGVLVVLDHEGSGEDGVGNGDGHVGVASLDFAREAAEEVAHAVVEEVHVGEVEAKGAVRGGAERDVLLHGLTVDRYLGSTKKRYICRYKNCSNTEMKNCNISRDNRLAIMPDRGVASDTQ